MLSVTDLQFKIRVSSTVRLSTKPNVRVRIQYLGVFSAQAVFYAA